jgi:hypothetical protein
MGAALVRIVKRVPSVAVGGMITAVTVLAWGGLYQAVPTPLPPADAGYGLAEPVPDCSSAYPNLRVCSQLPHWYMYGSHQEALDEIKRELGTSSLRTQNPSTATSGPCAGMGKHYNVRDPRYTDKRSYPASIVCCPCCDDDDLGDPREDRLCGIRYKDTSCDTRRRAVDASCED